jgi:septal ring factor EnvC (AmiA/AmiB activator)
MRWLLPFASVVMLLVAGAGAHAQQGEDAAALALAKREAAIATRRYQQLEADSRRATSDADRARTAAEALAARIEAAEADLTAAERRIAIIAGLQAAQRARLAARQGPVVRLTAALQTMTRRPAALALVQPGSVRDAVHVRSLLAATMPEIRRRTAALRDEVARSNMLRRQSELARQGQADSRAALQQRRVALARFEIEQRARSRQLAGLALSESDRALVFGEEAQALSRTLSTRAYQDALAASLAQLPGPIPRPGADSADSGPERAGPAYSLPVEGRLITGVGEISDGGVHARGLTFETAARARVSAPANGRIVYAAPFRRYGHVVIIDHGQGWSTVLTNLDTISVSAGQSIRRGGPVGEAGRGPSPRISVELRQAGRPVPLAQLIAG